MSRSTGKRTSTGYDLEKVRKYWSARLRLRDPLAAVLTFDAPPEVNRAYDAWERTTLLRLLKRPLRGKTVLDIGCGTGRLSLMLAQRRATVTGLDVSPAMLDFCAAEAKRRRLRNRLELICAPAHNIPCPSRKFDIVVCFGLLEHLPESKRRACLAEAARVLSYRGRLYLVVNNGNNPFLKRKYRTSKRAPQGRHVSLVGLRWLTGVCRDLRLKATLRAANPFYGLAHYLLLPHQRQLRLSSEDISVIFDLATELDLRQPLHEPLSRPFASHFVVELAGMRRSE